MSVVLQRIMILILFWSIVPSSTIFAKKVAPFNDIAKKVEQTRSAVEDIYYQLLKNHYFDDVNNPNNIYANNLVMATNLDDDPVAKGSILLSLIVWLEKKNDRDSRFLLRKINRLYHLEFHRTLSVLNPEYESYKDSLLSSFHDLSKYKTFHPAIGAIYPFGTSITKAILTLFVINRTTIPFEQKKESALYTLEQIKQEMLFINNNLGKDMIQDDIIRTFIFGLEKFGIKQTLVESKLFRNLVIISLVVGITGFIVYRWDVIGSGLNTVGTKLNELIKQATDGLGEWLGKGLAKGLIDNPQVQGATEEINNRVTTLETRINTALNDLPDLAGQAAENAVRGALRGAARRGPAPADHGQANGNNPLNVQQPGQDGQQLPVQPADNGVLAQNANDPNPDIQILIREALAPIRQGVGGALLFGDGQQRAWYNPARYFYGSVPQDQGQQLQAEQQQRAFYDPRGWRLFGGGNAPQPVPDVHHHDDDVENDE